MSDPVTNADIEDVLAQVRRLVLQAAPREVARAVGPASASDCTRLVLTPALRVGEAQGARVEAVPGPTRPEGPRAPAPEAALPPSAPFPGTGRRAKEAKGIEAALGAGAWEPDGSEALDWMLGGLDQEPGARPGGPPILPRRVPVAARAEPTQPPAPAATAVHAAPPSSAVLDQDVLRALVVEVVRAELQGELGERITRNLRKLVRSEVFRALEARQEP